MVAEIIVTHGLFVDEISTMVGVPWKEWSDECAITCYILSEHRTGEITTHCVLSGSADHVKTKVKR